MNTPNPRRQRGAASIETSVDRREDVPAAILDDVGLDTLVCMSSHGRGRVVGALVGSVTEALLRTIDQPVLVVGPHVPADFSFAGRVAACIDGSREAERTLEPARAWAAALGLPLWLVEVVHPSPPVEATTDELATEAADLGRLAKRMPDVAGWDTYHSRHPARELAERSASEPTALLVMATHGRAGWDRLRLGSVTAATVHASTVPVLVVPARRLASSSPVAASGWDTTER